MLLGYSVLSKQLETCKVVGCKMSHLFIFNLRILCIYLLGYLVEYCSPAEDCEWSAWTERDSDEFQHRAMECDGKVEIESRNCNITTCSISNGEDP